MSIQTWSTQLVVVENLSEDNSAEELENFDQPELFCLVQTNGLKIYTSNIQTFENVDPLQSHHFFEIPSPPPEIGL